jgi:hypothetical protein
MLTEGRPVDIRLSGSARDFEVHLKIQRGPEIMNQPYVWSAFILDHTLFQEWRVTELAFFLEANITYMVKHLMSNIQQQTTLKLDFAK